jgi:hypothetical protein
MLDNVPVFTYLNALGRGALKGQTQDKFKAAGVGMFVLKRSGGTSLINGNLWRPSRSGWRWQVGRSLHCCPGSLDLIDRDLSNEIFGPPPSAVCVDAVAAETPGPRCEA